jgi:flagellar biosynthesis GTPase FlhF
VSETHTYRGESLDEILPRIRAELGPDAVITRRREGIVGGVGGFFGKKCLEVEASAPGEWPREVQPVARPAVPARSIVDVYDDDDSGSLMDDLLAQAAPFADLLDDAIALAEAPEHSGRIDTNGNGSGYANGNGNGSAVHRLEDGVRDALLRAAIPAKIAQAIVAEAEGELAPFAPEEPLAEHVRRALARRLRVRHRGRKQRRVVAFVGPAGAGKTAATLSLCAAHARRGTSVCALSLESARRAVDLALATDVLPISVELADSPEAVELVRAKLRRTELVVADTPAADPADPESIRRVAALVAALKPTETHLVVPAGAPAEAARLLLAGLREQAAVSSLLIADAGGVGVSLWAGLPVSYVATRDGLRPAEPHELARLVLP